MAVEFFHSQKRWEDALHVIEKMKQRKVNIHFYLEKPMLHDIFKANKVEDDTEDEVIDEDARAQL